MQRMIFIHLMDDIHPQTPQPATGSYSPRRVHWKIAADKPGAASTTSPRKAPGPPAPATPPDVLHLAEVFGTGVLIRA